jgi:ElaA protein
VSGTLVWRRFEELSLDELYDALALRAEVFVAEQRSPYLDVDGRDRGALHLLAMAADGDLSGYLRVLPPPGPRGSARIGRLVCAPTARGRGLARRMMTAALGRIAESWPQATIALAAQTQIAGFYESFGFRRVGDDYDEDGVRHCDMVLLAPAAAP